MVESRGVSRVSSSDSLNPRWQVGLAIGLKTLGKSCLHFVSILGDLSLVLENTLESHG